MSTLLQHSKVRYTLSLLGIEEPESDPIYRSMQDLFVKASEYSDDESGDLVFVRHIECGYVYDTVSSGKRKSIFTISKVSEHELSQIFISIIFMKYGLMNHRTRLVIDKNMPLHIIRISENFIRGTR